MSNQKKIQEVIDELEKAVASSESNVVQLRPKQKTIPAEITNLMDETGKLVIKDLKSALNRMVELEHRLLCKASEFCSTEQFNKVAEDFANSDKFEGGVEDINYNWAQAFIAIHTLKQDDFYDQEK